MNLDKRIFFASRDEAEFMLHHLKLVGCAVVHMSYIYNKHTANKPPEVVFNTDKLPLICDASFGHWLMMNEHYGVGRGIINNRTVLFGFEQLTTSDHDAHGWTIIKLRSNL